MIIEKVDIVALRYGARIWSLPRPARHGHVIKHMDEQGLCEEARLSEQGFLTNKNRFVNRNEGAQFALAAKQIDELRWPPRLYSEDLW